MINPEVAEDMAALTKDCVTDQERRHLRQVYAIGFAKAAIRRALDLADPSSLTEALEILEAVS